MFLIGVGAAVIGWLAMHYLYWNTPTDERKRLMMVATMAVVLVCMATLQRALDAFAMATARRRGRFVLLSACATCTLRVRASQAEGKGLSG